MLGKAPRDSSGLGVSENPIESHSLAIWIYTEIYIQHSYHFIPILNISKYNITDLKLLNENSWPSERALVKNMVDFVSPLSF